MRLRLLPALALAALVAAGCGNRAPGVQRFESRPDLTPPVVTVTTPAQGTSPGYVFIAPKRDVVQSGPLILDDAGQVVWFGALDTGGIADFRAQLYHGEPVLTWWRGRATKGVGDGYDVIVDSSYREIARVRAGNGLAADIHEFLLTPRGTALITVYHRLPADLSALGGPKEGKVFEGVIQELAIPSGRVLFEWHSIDHVALAESYSPAPPAKQGAAADPYDYFHVNSVAEDADGNLIVSARNTHAIYKIDRATGEVLWRLGGKESDFALGPGTRFGWQHDARPHPDGTISLFDNSADPPIAKQSRALVLRVDEATRRAELVRSYAHPGGLLSGSQGNLQLLPDGHAFVGWGSNPNFTEYDAEGRVIFDGRFSAGADSYRAYRLAWTGHPATVPDLAVRSDRRGRVTAYASWNGATGVARWQLLAGADPDHLREIEAAPKTAFETRFELGWLHGRYVAVRALGAGGDVLGTSAVQIRPAR